MPLDAGILDSRIPLAAGASTPKIHTPAENQQIVADAENARTIADANRLKLEEAKRAQADQQAMQRVMQEAGGDWEVALPRLRTVAPGAAAALEEQLAKTRKERALALKGDLETEALQTQRGLALLRAIPEGDAEMYAALKDRIIQMAPDLQGILPEQYDPAVLRQVQSAGETAKDAIARNQKALELLAEGKWHTAAGTALSAARDQEDWDEAITGLREMGVPRQVLQQFGAWSPTAAARAGQLAMTPDVRADNDRAERGQAATIAHQQAAEAIDRGQLAVSQGNLQVARGNLAQRITEEKRQAEQAKTAGAGGPKLTAGMATQVAGVEQSLSVLDSMEKNLPSSIIGPIAGRWTKLSTSMPGAPVPAPVAKYMAEEATLRNAVIKATTGAAMSEPEAQRIMEQIPSMTDKPEVWRAKATTTRENLSLLRRRMLELSGVPGDLPASVGSSGVADTSAPTKRVNPFRKTADAR